MPQLGKLRFTALRQWAVQLRKSLEWLAYPMTQLYLLRITCYSGRMQLSHTTPEFA